MRHGIYWDAPAGAALDPMVPGLGLSILITIAFGMTMFALASRQARRSTRGDLH
jgi:hypothetical protein